MPKVAVQINGVPPCPIWSQIAKEHGVESIFIDYHQSIDLIPHRPDLIVTQGWTHTRDFYEMGWDRIGCPIVGSCGDSLALTQLGTLFRNVLLMSRVHVVGQDYIERYVQSGGTEVHKFIYQHLCADNHFPLVDHFEKPYDWCFIGQVYPAHEQRLKHYRNDIIPQLLDVCPNGLVAGPGWKRILGDRAVGGQWIDQSLLNQLYVRCVVTVSIDAHDGAGYASTRPIEMMHAGHCTFIYDHPGMTYFKKFVHDGTHAFYFRTPQEFADRLQHVKQNPEIARQVGLAARAVVLENRWTASAWMRQCLELLK